MNRLLKILGGTLLVTMLTVGCANNDQNPPPENNNGTFNDNGLNNGDRNDNLNDGTDNGNGNKNMNFDRNRNGNNGNMNMNNRGGAGDGWDMNGLDNGRGNDVNLPGDGDPTTDNNSPAEELFEDRLDRNDRDNRDR